MLLLVRPGTPSKRPLLLVVRSFLADSKAARSKRMGEGGFGAVFRGMQQDGTEIAVKAPSAPSGLAMASRGALGLATLAELWWRLNGVWLTLQSDANGCQWMSRVWFVFDLIVSLFCSSLSAALPASLFAVSCQALDNARESGFEEEARVAARATLFSFSNKKLVVTSASLLVTSALLVVTRSYLKRRKSGGASAEYVSTSQPGGLDGFRP